MDSSENTNQTWNQITIQIFSQTQINMHVRTYNEQHVEFQQQNSDIQQLKH